MDAIAFPKTSQGIFVVAWVCFAMDRSVLKHFLTTNIPVASVHLPSWRSSKQQTVMIGDMLWDVCSSKVNRFNVVFNWKIFKMLGDEKRLVKLKSGLKAWNIGHTKFFIFFFIIILFFFFFFFLPSEMSTFLLFFDRSMQRWRYRRVLIGNGYCLPNGVEVGTYSLCWTNISMPHHHSVRVEWMRMD